VPRVLDFRSNIERISLECVVGLLSPLGRPQLSA
jgi:hypothetical protein